MPVKTVNFLHLRFLLSWRMEAGPGPAAGSQLCIRRTWAVGVARNCFVCEREFSGMTVLILLPRLL